MSHETLSRVLLFFFFQAEDGIRDYKVTGVQTCALPILIQFSAPLAGRPYGLAISFKDVAYITQLDASRVARVDLPSGFGFTASVAVGAIPTSVAFDKNGETAWVTNQLSSPSTLGRIDVATNTQVQTYASGGPSGLG